MWKAERKETCRTGQGVANIEITDKNIKDFERIARKYGVDFALKKDKTGEVPKYLVFFKARDADALTAAFKEYTAKSDRKRNARPYSKSSAGSRKPQRTLTRRRFAKRSWTHDETDKLQKADFAQHPIFVHRLFATKLGQAARLSPGVDFSSKVLNMMDGISMAFENILPSFHPVDLLVGTAAAVIIRLVVYFKGKNAKKFRKNLEYGSARWGNREDIAPFVDPVFENNIILTANRAIDDVDRPKEPKNARTKMCW